MITYSVRATSPHLHTLSVEVRVPDPGEELLFSIPAWTPGSYLLREFARYLGEPTCEIDGRAAVATKIAKGTWSVPTDGAHEAVVRYDVHGHELTVRTPHIDASHAFFVGTNALVYVHGRETGPSRTVVHAPDGWEVFCPLDRDPAGAWLAPDYDVLADAPFEIGPHPSHDFDVLGVPHRLVFWGADAVDLDLEKLTADVTALVHNNAALFGGELPYSRYDFIFHITDVARGGLEHLNSCVLATPWRHFDTDDGHAEMLGLISHEHFHTWNVKRIRPRTLGPFDYQVENHTTALWVVEGFTSYFDQLGCLRAGVIDNGRYLEGLGKAICRLLAVPGRFEQSLAQASWDAWIRLYRPDPNTPNRTVSYYLKGALVALGLDMTIRQRSEGRRSLDDVMRALWDQFRETGQGYDERTLARLIVDATGVDVSELLDDWVYGTGEPDFEAVLETHGVTLETTADGDPWLGMELDPTPNGVAVRHVRKDGPAHGADVAPGDVIVAIDDRQATADTLAGIRARFQPGTPVTAHLFRRGLLRTVSLTPTDAPVSEVRLALVAEPTDDQRRHYELWTRRPWPTGAPAD